MRIALIGAGVVAMGAGLVALVGQPGALIFMVAVLVLHDGLFLPLVGLVGRWVPVTAGVVGISVVVVAFPLVLGVGRAADNASVLPLAYPGNLVLILGLVVLAAIGKGLVRRRWRRKPAVHE